ncbi:DUF2516 family protein [Mycobacterium sp. Z3061]|uniref:DUF2516 family protein n=1 Tax=Mycobacterium sp. Z3061 TaxID=3073562 RepID=UPI002872FEBB|nr:DUF2516 family protein [Mycobacterium sp. Z3061]
MSVQAVVTVMFVLRVAVAVATVYAFVHAALQRSDAYTAADKQTKALWLVILGGAMALITIGIFGVMAIAAAAVATGVYLVDVRPKLLEVQGKSR